MSNNEIRRLCLAEEGEKVVLQGNIAFAVGCVRSGIHSADGYPGTPSTEVIDRGLSRVQDLIKVGWSVNEAVAVGVAFGHTLAGEDSVVTMKIPGLFQACDVFTSSALFYEERGALIYFIASDFTPSSTQHVIDPRYLFKSSMVPVFEPRSHQEMLEASGIAAEIGRRYRTPFVIFASGTLCHSEGLVILNSAGKRDVLDIPEDLKKFNLLPPIARVNYDTVVAERMPGLEKMVEESPLNRWIRGSGKKGVITYGITTAYVKEVREIYGEDFDILSLAFTNPLPLKLMQEFYGSMKGDVYIFEDGYQFLQEAMERLGLKVIGKESYSGITEWSPALVAERMGYGVKKKKVKLEPVPRPPMICAGCLYRLFALEVARLKKRKKIEAIFGDIGCNSLLYFMGVLDTGLAMGASDSKRQGFVLSRPEKAARCMSIIGDSTECHSGLDATRNAVFRKVPGIKVVLDNYWTAMTGGQPAPSSPVNLAGDEVRFDLARALKSNGCRVLEVNAYEGKDIRKALKDALSLAEKDEFVVILVRGSCINKIPGDKKGVRLKISREKCDKCHICLICPGIEEGEDGFPQFSNLCSGCAGENPACMQMCPFDAMEFLGEEEVTQKTLAEFPKPPEIMKRQFDRSTLPERLTLAIRGVGGQGTLFFGRVLTQLAFLAGYGERNIVKGETHGMAQMGGPVISTFSCGKVHSPVLFPGSADCLITMEVSEILRPGFLDLLKEGGTILISKTSIIPQVITPEEYPAPERIKGALGEYRIIEVDALGSAIEIGDKTGRVANVVMIGALSRIAPFNGFPLDLWLEAIRKVSPNPAFWAANYAAFMAGRELL
ncbi:MAG: 2-oxoacid:acceptor oxidoreductase family protein [Deltaproteobacteria bacterium]|nr:2-oxoacid:acceptor oxidoreductase family protein [Deltaproteobacteria bacterium]